MIVSLLSLKGGVGKTTSAIHLASCAAREDQPVTLYDLDPEGSAQSWHNQAEANKKPLRFAVEFGKMPTSKTGVHIIDTPPNRRDVVLEVARASDFVVIPVAPTGLDVDRLRNTLEELAKLDELNVSILLTKFDDRRSLAKNALEALTDYPVFESRIRNLAKYEQAFARDPKYISEYWNVWDELKEMMK
jgi:chromosome partitioning protein